MAKIIVGAAMLVAGIALIIYCGPMGAAAMMALYGAIAPTGFSMATPKIQRRALPTPNQLTGEIDGPMIRHSFPAGRTMTDNLRGHVERCTPCLP